VNATQTIGPLDGADLWRIRGSSSTSAVVGTASFVPFRHLLHLSFRKPLLVQPDPPRIGLVFFNTTVPHFEASPPLQYVKRLNDSIFVTKIGAPARK
jgi:hypothetical protein